MRVPSLALLSLLTATAALDNGLARTPPMGWNSWMAIGWSISEAEVHSVAAYLQSSGLQAKGYTGVFSDDGWSAHRDPDTGRIIPDPKRWPNGLNNVTDFLHALWPVLVSVLRGLLWAPGLAVL
jgi:alpha-galactosidase